MVEIVFCTFTGRCLKNYEPLLEMALYHGNDVSIVAFPRLCDPDYIKIYETYINIQKSYPIDYNCTLIGSSLENVLNCIGSPDILLLGSCNMGPESMIGENTKAKNTIGLQHGFVQDWNIYNKNTSISKFGVFGHAFSRLICKDSIVTTLPKLDCIKFIGTNNDGYILYASQHCEQPNNIKEVLSGVEKISGKRVIVRAHPEGISHISDLMNYFQMVEESNIIDCLEQACLVITTGSTVVLECLVAGVPVVVLPSCNGEEYIPAGIVASDMSAEAIVKIWHGHPSRLSQTKMFLQYYTGSADNNRTKIGYNNIMGILKHYK